MTDKELLELAAKAAGKEIEWKKCASHIDDYELTGISGPWVNGLWWNPLTDDGDAFRIAVKLDLLGNSFGYDNAVAQSQKDPYEATSRAIVRAAAEIGKTL